MAILEIRATVSGGRLRILKNDVAIFLFLVNGM